MLYFLRDRSRRAADFDSALRRLALAPREYPPEVAELDASFRALADLLRAVEARPGMSPRDLAAASRRADEAASAWSHSAEIVSRRVVEQAAPYDGEAPYPVAAETWRAYDELIAGFGLTFLARTKVQGLMRRAEDSGRLWPFLLPACSFKDREDAFAAGRMNERLARHTPLPRLGEKTVRQAEDEATREGRCPQLEEAIELWMTGDRASRAEADKLLQGLWEAYIDGRHARGGQNPWAAQRDLVALLRGARRILHQDGDPQRRRHAAKALLRLRSTFVLREYYPEVKELVLEGLADQDGYVRRAFARFCESALWSLREETRLHDDLGAALERLAKRLGPARPGPALPSPAKSIDQALGSYRHCTARSKARTRRPSGDDAGEIAH